MKFRTALMTRERGTKEWSVLRTDQSRDELEFQKQRWIQCGYFDNHEFVITSNAVKS